MRELLLGSPIGFVTVAIAVVVGDIGMSLGVTDDTMGSHASNPTNDTTLEHKHSPRHTPPALRNQPTRPTNDHETIPRRERVGPRWALADLNHRSLRYERRALNLTKLRALHRLLRTPPIQCAEVAQRERDEFCYP
jgi:hypothetical protein